MSKLLTGLLCIISPSVIMAQSEWAGSVAVQHEYFSQSPLHTDQNESTSLINAKIEYYQPLKNNAQLTFIAFAQQELNGDKDGHADIREAQYLSYGDDWELRAGIGKVFWGVTESVHLVDIINQDDLREDSGGEQKLGQPMLQLSWLTQTGTYHAFALPYFRERFLPESGDRPRYVLPVNNDAAQYESKDEEKHIDYALRWTHNIDALDLGLSFFKGTNREPTLKISGSELTPYYDQIDQLGLDAQYTSEAWLWKLESINRKNAVDDHTATAAGFEYTLYSLFESSSDLGIISEYLFDSRDQAATGPFQNDLMIGLRWAMNDEQSSEMLLGLIQDLDTSTRVMNLEASRRFGSNIKLSLDARVYHAEADDPGAYTLRRDDFLRLKGEYYF